MAGLTSERRNEILSRRMGGFALTQELLAEIDRLKDIEKKYDAMMNALVAHDVELAQTIIDRAGSAGSDPEWLSEC